MSARSNRLVAAVLALAALAGSALWWITRPADLTPATRAALRAHAPDPDNGARVFWAGGCAGCHAAPGLTMADPVDRRLVLSGGRALVSDFGTFRAPNVSMDPVYGIGGWTLEQFARAMLHGVGPGGQHYYPAFPYTSYRQVLPQDIADLWAFWQGLPADATPSVAPDLPWPLRLRRAIGLWKALTPAPAQPIAGHTAGHADDARARGRYLVEALAHCGECHTPRDRIGRLEHGNWLQGAPNPSGPGRIPAIPASDWTQADLAFYLETGFAPSFDVVGGAMADVVVQMAQLPQSDREAIAAYLVGLRDSPIRASPNR